jgi:hypothetical protein
MTLGRMSEFKRSEILTEEVKSFKHRDAYRTYSRKQHFVFRFRVHGTEPLSSPWTQENHVLRS